MTAHQRLAIRARLPEVCGVQHRDDRDPVEVSFVRLELRDGSTVVIYGTSDDVVRRCRRTRRRSDYSDRADILSIDAEMRERLVAVFGSLSFDP